MFRRIMVPLDGSTAAERALPAALELARRTDARLELVHVHMPEPAARRHPGFLDVPRLLGRAQQRYGRSWEAAVARMHELTLRLRGSETIEVFAHVAQGDAIAPELVRRARNTFADVVVMTARGTPKPGAGAVVAHLVRQLGVPVLLLRPDALTTGAAIDFRHVVVPLDGSERSEDVLPAARRLAHPFGSRATLLRVLDPGGRSRSGREEDPERTHELETTSYLEGVAGRMAVDWVQPSLVMRRHPSVASAILEVATDEGADVIAMATHGRTGVSKLMLGSVAEEVLRSSRLPLLLLGPAAARRHAAAMQAVAEAPVPA